MTLDDLDFRPLPPDPNDLTAEAALSACGGDVDRVFRNILASLTPSHSHQDSTFEEAQLHAVKLA